MTQPPQDPSQSPDPRPDPQPGGQPDRRPDPQPDPQPELRPPVDQPPVSPPPVWAPPPLSSGPPTYVPPGTWQTWALPAPGPRFDPSDPLISDTYGGWWRRSLALLRAGWRKLALIHLVVLVPTLAMLVPSEILLERQQRELARSLDAEALPSFSDIVGPQLTSSALSAIPALISMLGILVSVLVLVALATGGTPSIGAALRTAVRRVLPLLGWNVLAGIITVAAVIACILPVLYVAAVFMILTVVVALERTNAVRRCFELFHADLGAALGRIATLAGIAIGGSLVLGALTLIVSIAVQGSSAALDPSIAVPESTIVAVGVSNALLGALSYLVAGILGTPFLLTAYADMRARREPFTSLSLSPS